MIENFIGVPVVGKDRIAAVHTQDGVVLVVRGFGPNVAGCAALLAFCDDVAFLSFGLDFGLGLGLKVRCCVHTVSATASASAAAAMLVRFFASAA